MSGYVFRPMHFDDIPKGVKIDVHADEHILFFGNKQNTLWLLDRFPSEQGHLELFIVHDKDAQYFAANGKNITAAVYARSLLKTIADFGLEMEYLTVNTKRNCIANVDKEFITNLQAAADYCLQYYHCSSDTALFQNMLKR